MDDFHKYAEMRDRGVGSVDVYRTGVADGLDTFARVRMLRKVFNLSLDQAKEVIIIGDGIATSSNVHQERIAMQIEESSQVKPKDGLARHPG